MPTKRRGKLVEFFERNGQVRLPDLARRAEVGREYHKGWEIRMTVRSRSELAALRRLLELEGFRLGTPFAKGTGLVQPLYGKHQVERLQALLLAAGTKRSRVYPSSDAAGGASAHKSGSS